MDLKRVGWLVLLAAWLTAVSWADTIVLKSNREINGVILEADADSTYVELFIPKVGKMKILKRDIAEIIWNDDDGSTYVEEFGATPPRVGASNPGSNPEPDPDATDPDTPADGDVEETILGEIEVADPPGPNSSQQDEIDLWLRRLGDMRRRGGAGTRRIMAVKELARLAPVSLKAVEGEMSSANLYARRNAFLIFEDVGRQKDMKKYLWKMIPKFARGVGDDDYQVRANANRALEALTGKNQSYPGARENSPPSEAELKTQAAWQKFWQDVEPEIEAAVAKAQEEQE